MTALMANIAVAAALALTGIAALLAAVGLLSWRRVGHPRLLWITVAFVVFAAQGVVFLLDALANRSGDAVPVVNLLSIAAVAALYVAVLR